MGKWPVFDFEEAIFDDTKNGTKIKKEDYLEQGLYPVIDQGQNHIAGYRNTADGLYNNIPAIIFGDHTRVIKYVDTPFFLGADGVKLLKSKKECQSYKYLYYFFLKNEVPNTGYNRHFKWLKELKIPLPPLETQKQIAKTLDTAAEPLAMRKQQLAELDNLIKSIFYDMFGDPVTNEKGWETIVLSDCLDKIESGWSPICEDRAVIGEEWGVCKLSAVTGGYYKEIENKSMLKDTEIKLTLRVKNGDLLFSRKNTSQLVGSCAYVFESTKKLMIPDTIFRLCTKCNIQKLYLWGLINCQTFKPVVQQLAGGSSGSMPNISKERLRRLEIPLPSFSKQTQFADIVTKIEEQKTLVKKAIDETQYLFDSLMSEYFE